MKIITAIFLSILLTSQIIFAEDNDSRLKNNHKQISIILKSEKTVKEKLKALLPYIQIGDKRKDIEKKLGSIFDSDGHGSGFDIVVYSLSGIRVEYYPDGVCHAIGYKKLDLIKLGSVSWPRAKEEDKKIKKLRKGD